uniref:TATA box-binding protein-like 1 n=1 Tax=Xenopsylla cheopis TaxID=163159 RepID=A0A6M2DJB2_XENCH
MATILQKSGVKSLANGNSLVHAHEVHDMAPIQELPVEQVPSNEINSETAPQLVEDEEPEIDIVINNVVCSFSVRCHLNLRDIALNGVNVEFRRENGMVTMKLRRPYTTASIWSSGRITCTGATSEEQAKIAARRYARCLQKLGFQVRFHNFRVVNVLGTCSMPFAIKITAFSEKFRDCAEYEPELHPGVTYKIKQPKATLKIFSTGSITVTARSVQDVQHAIEHIFPLVYEFRKLRTPVDQEIWEAKRNARTLKRRYSESKAPSSGLGIDLSDEEDIVDSEEVDDWE